MGATLNGYLLVGPKEVKAKREEAVKEASYAIGMIAEIGRAIANGVAFEELEYISFLEDKGFDPDDVGLDELMFTKVEELNSEEFVDSFIATWENGFPYRDTTWRNHGENCIVFAGEMTWGDEPDGAGYELIKLAEMLGVLEALGIE